MELHEAIRRRAMVRSFSTEPVEPAVVDRHPPRRPALARRRATRPGTAWVVLEGPEQTAAYFDATTDDAWRAASTPSGPTACGGRPSSSSPTPRPMPTWPATPSRTRPRRGWATAPTAWPVPYWYRRRRLRRHGRPPRRGRRRARRLRPRRLPGRGGAGRSARRPHRVAPLLRGRARAPRRPRSPVCLARPAHFVPNRSVASGTMVIWP